MEQGYQQMKEELGLDHFEGRSWRGFHHHACLVMLAFGFLALERNRTGAVGPSGDVRRDRLRAPAEKNAGPPPVTVPGVRRAMQRLIVPVCRPGCPNYQSCVPSPEGSEGPAPTVHPP